MWLLRDFLRMSFFCCCATKQAQNSLKYFKLKFQSNSMFFFVCKDLTWLGCRRKKKKTARLSFFPLSAFRLRLIHIKKVNSLKTLYLFVLWIIIFCLNILFLQPTATRCGVGMSRRIEFKYFQQTLQTFLQSHMILAGRISQYFTALACSKSSNSNQNEYKVFFYYPPSLNILFRRLRLMSL